MKNENKEPGTIWVPLSGSSGGSSWRKKVGHGPLCWLAGVLSYCFGSMKRSNSHSVLRVLKEMMTFFFLLSGNTCFVWDHLNVQCEGLSLKAADWCSARRSYSDINCLLRVDKLKRKFKANFLSVSRPKSGSRSCFGWVVVSWAFVPFF